MSLIHSPPHTHHHHAPHLPHSKHHTCVKTMVLSEWPMMYSMASSPRLSYSGTQ